ncbi:hypothetical protein [Magnetovibrio sp.]|uniref:hypothetical protein n=1 Tax=Magnetovibrio sp. TaxID=2024836 RepID=UPI002F949E52
MAYLEAQKQQVQVNRLPRAWGQNGPNQTLPKLLLSGLDSLYVSFYLDTTTCTIDWDELAYQKEKAGRERNKGFEKLELGTEHLALQPYGKKPYRYVLSNKLFEVRLSEGLSPSCHVQFFSEALWIHGFEALTTRFKAWAESLKLHTLQSETVSRADWAFDYHLPNADFAPDHLVSRATKKATWEEHNIVQTIQCGTGETVVRIYDKVAEIEQQSDKAWFHELWGQKDDVWRVEFQVRGERLKQGGIRTLEDLTHLQTDLLRELATSHTTLRRPNGDSNRSRWPLHPLWAQLTKDILQGPQMGLMRSYDEMVGVEWRLDRNGKSVHGYLKNMAALLQIFRKCKETLTLEETITAMSAIIERHHSEELWRSDVERRVKAIELGQ